MKLRQQPSSRNSSRSKTRRNSRCCSYPTARTKPKAGTGTNCNLNAQEQDKQHIELQKQHPDLPEQAPPHESHQQPFDRNGNRRNSRCCQSPHRTQSTNLHQLQFKCTGTRLGTLLQQQVLPFSGTFKCRTLTRLGMTGVIAGIRRRPKLPNPMATMQYVKFYPDNLKGIAFDQPIWVKDLQPTIHFAEIF